MKSKGDRRKGIYCVYIDGIPYVGKDWDIQRRKRIKTHLASLKRNAHWNSKMQANYNRTNDFRYEVLEEFDKTMSDEDLCRKEEYYIGLKGSYVNGYNKTLGGIGLKGVVFTEEQLEAKSNNVTGDKNHMSKLSLDDFRGVVRMLRDNRTNSEIATEYGLHSRYVSLIRNKKRYKKWFEEYEPEYTVVNSPESKTSAYKLSKNEVK